MQLAECASVDEARSLYAEDETLVKLIGFRNIATLADRDAAVSEIVTFLTFTNMLPAYQELVLFVCIYTIFAYYK